MGDIEALNALLSKLGITLNNKLNFDSKSPIELTKNDFKTPRPAPLMDDSRQSNHNSCTDLTLVVSKLFSKLFRNHQC